jgi:hypothetical protein
MMSGGYTEAAEQMELEEATVQILRYRRRATAGGAMAA